MQYERLSVTIIPCAECTADNCRAKTMAMKMEEKQLPSDLDKLASEVNDRAAHESIGGAVKIEDGSVIFTANLNCSAVIKITPH